MLLFLIGALACYRLALMLSSDSGPWRVFTKLRSFLRKEEKKHPAVKKSDVAAGLSCLRCTSVWLASAIASYGWYRDSITGWPLMAGDTFLIGMALSASALLMNRLLPPKV